MEFVETPLSDLLIIKPNLFGDVRGFFQESWNKKDFCAGIGYEVEFVQDNHSRSSRGVLRGLHYQIKQPQGKLVRVVAGTVLDVAVDLRKSSSTFGEYFSVEISEENQMQLWVPPGYAHGFMVLSDSADFLYKTTDFYAPEFERCIRWDDKDLRIDWKLGGMEPVVSGKDGVGVPFLEAEYFADL